VPTATLPVFPELLDPELKYNDPLAPFVPAFKLRITTTPLVDAVPSPDEMRMTPPVNNVLRPEDTYTSPPTPLVPLPTLTTIAPLRPAVDVPEPKKTAPELPLVAVPVLKYSAPLAPLVPPFADRILTMPLVVAVPSPLTKLNKPPVFTVLKPAATRT